MVEKLQAYLDELIAAKEATMSADYTEAIKAEAAEYEEAIRARYEGARDAKLNELNVNIAYVTSILEREVAAATEVVEANTITE